ncbi:unnamed protein product [Adineta steineri]|uniref:Uncharacterized protein n=1 Tax=Adineta steineri TaxID=433720 RepID=A0A814JSA6_9BILA|nr:unnamed protein product [Adineta steineri]CAF3877129.1 unnamed protein product [Adineta steineri]
MQRITSWFSKKTIQPPTTISRRDFIESLIVHKQVKEFTSCLQKKDERSWCIDGYFNLLPTILDEKYMADIFEIISKNSRVTSKELSNIIVSKLVGAIHDGNFDLFEKILHLPFQSSIQIPVQTYDLIRFLHTCTNTDQLMRCLSVLVEKNLRHDPEYLSWLLIILFEHYKTGDEIIIEYLLNIKKDINILFTCYGNHRVTPLMLFFHLNSNNKCQILIDNYLSNINDQSVLLQCDQWNRSYLMHLLCGQCQHDPIGYSTKVLSNDITEMEKDLIDQCPHASDILSKFSMLHKLGNKCDTPVKTILKSLYCVPLRIILLNYLRKNDPLFEMNLEELFTYFPSNSISTYSNYLKQLTHNHNLNHALTSVIVNQTCNLHSMEHTFTFLVREGARIENRNTVQFGIGNLLRHYPSRIPFILLDYGMHIDLPFDQSINQLNPKIILYICRVIQCGYPSEFRTQFDLFKSRLDSQTVELIKTFIDIKNPQKLKNLCYQKLRSSLIHLGDDTQEKLKDHLSDRLRRWITLYGYNECSVYYRTVMH